MDCLEGRFFNSEKEKFVGGKIYFENGVITEVIECVNEGDLISPGLVDVHTHGREGKDFLTADENDLLDLKDSFAKIGVTSVVPTLASGTLDEMLKATERIKHTGFDALHIEGRYLAPSKRGAHSEKLIAPLNPEEIDLFKSAAGDMKLHISAAYELNRAFFNKALESGITTGLGHSNANYEEAMFFAQNGLRSFTHLFNAMTNFHHRAGGIPVAALLSDCYCEIICDGFHLAPEVVKLVSAYKSVHKIVLISDSMEGTGCHDGQYSIAGLPVNLVDGKAYTVEGAIAGSTLSLPDAVKHYSEYCGVSYEKALICATSNPADMLGLNRVGKIRAGCRADFIVLDNNYNIKKVFKNGVEI